MQPGDIDHGAKNSYTHSKGQHFFRPMKTYDITIGRETFPIKSDASEAHVKALAKEVQDRYDQMNTRKGPRASQGFRAMTMVALVLLDELQELRQQHASFKKESTTFATTLTARIDAILEGKD